MSDSNFPLMGKWLNSKNSIHCPLDHDGIKLQGEDPDNPNADDTILEQCLTEYTWAYGGFLEKRKLYERSAHFKEDNNFRNIHLGLDIWGETYQKIYAPFELEIHSFTNNDKHGDYGPTVIFKGNEAFPYILCGHLTTANLELWESKKFYRKGEIIGHFGSRVENGGWYPHVHLQVMRDMENYQGDYPGVWAESKINRMQDNLVNPIDLVYLEME